jgi:glyoxylase-like metal-dependent hydrolase (beta-lactamase superfamily II)
MKKEDIILIEMTFVNAFLIKVIDGFILIDTGLAMYWKELEHELVAAGCLPGNLKLVIITHGDLDHTGNCLKLQEKYKCKVAIHKDDSFQAENGIFVKRKIRTFTGRIFVMIRRLKRRGKFTFEKFKPDIYLTEGQKLTEYGLDATVIHIPGHTKGSIGIITDDGILFAGDIFTNRKKPDLATYIENTRDLENSYARLKTMQIKTIYPGHGKPFGIEQIARKIAKS